MPPAAGSSRPHAQRPDPGAESRVGGRIRGFHAGLAYALVVLIIAIALLSVGLRGPLANRVLIAIVVTIDSGWAPLLYLLGALGLGRVARPLLGAVPTHRAIELGVGLTLTLSLSHLLGVLGWLSTPWAWLVTGIGLAMLLTEGAKSSPQSIRARIERLRLTLPGALMVIGAVLALLMSLNPPGLLWDSEYNGYDALSYHLQLPREWFDNGRLAPLDHNIYSYLPSYIEAAYLHMAHMMGANLPYQHGRGLISAQLLSLGLLIACAASIGVLTRRLAASHAPDADSQLCARLAGVLTLATPWLIVTGSLAYNELGVVLLGTCALACAIETEISPRVRGALMALMVAGACSCKPTAIFLLAPTVAIALLAATPRRAWLPTISIGLLVGVLTLSPWLVRNQLAAGNPVFPQLASVFGQGPWSAEQHALYASAHHFDGSLLDRLRLLALPDAGGPDHVSSFRGFTNLQWGLTPTLGLLGCVGLLALGRTRTLGMLIALALLLPTLAWLTLTHLQSRFLIPLAPTLIIAAALGLAIMRPWRLARALGHALALVAMGFSVLWSLSQNSDDPFMLLELGPGVFIGDLPIESPPWSATLNQIADPGDTIYLLSDATPLYVRNPVIYNTVYDHWPIARVIGANPGQPAAWTQSLRDEGATLVVINFAEINRFARSGWLPSEIQHSQLISWGETLGGPIHTWRHPVTGAPVRAAYRIAPPVSSAAP